MMSRANFLQAYPGQFSEGVFPDPRLRPWRGDSDVHLQHRIICCDCGLAHDFEFIIVETAVRRGNVQMVKLAPKKYAIQFRARRNERATAQIRRKPQAKT